MYGSWSIVLVNFNLSSRFKSNNNMTESLHENQRALSELISVLVTQNHIQALEINEIKRKVTELGQEKRLFDEILYNYISTKSGASPFNRTERKFEVVDKLFKVSFLLITIVMFTFATSVFIIHLLRLVSSHEIQKEYMNEGAIIFPENDFQDVVLVHSKGQESNKEFEKGLKYNLVTRDMWGGRPPLYTEPLAHPVPLVIIAHTATPLCSSFKACAARVQNIQSYHVAEMQMPDISYNFLIGGDGNVYEGRGWNTQNALRKNSIIISFIGNFIYDVLSPEMIRATRSLLKSGVVSGKLSMDYTLVCHNQTVPTVSPGPNVYKEVKTWPHFKPGPYF